MKTYPRTYIKNNTKVSDILNSKNINPARRQAACIFDTNGDGVYTGSEVTLFNATTCKQDSNGDLTLWTNFSNGKKVKNTFSKDELILNTLKNNRTSIQKIKRPVAFDEWVTDKKGCSYEKDVQIYNNFNIVSYSQVRETRKKELNKLVSKYNLIGKNINSEIFNTSKNIIRKFHKEYGNPLSATMEYLLVSPFFKVNSNISDKGRNVCGKWHTFYSKNTKELLEKRSNLIKKNHFANCDQQTEMIAKLFYDNYKFKYNIKTIYTEHADNSNKGHQATLITSKDGKEEYVIDTWICKEGGIFKKSDWQKLISELYSSQNVTIDTSQGNMGFFKLDHQQHK